MIWFQEEKKKKEKKRRNIAFRGVEDASFVCREDLVGLLPLYFDVDGSWRYLSREEIHFRPFAAKEEHSACRLLFRLILVVLACASEKPRA